MNSPPSGAIAVLNMNTVYHVSTYSQVIGSHLADIQRCQVRVPGVPRKRARTWRARLLGRLRGSDATDDVLRAVEVVDRAVARDVDRLQVGVGRAGRGERAAHDRLKDAQRAQVVEHVVSGSGIFHEHSLPWCPHTVK